MINNVIDFRRLSQEVNKRNKQIAKILSNDMFEDITESEWNTLIEAEDDPILRILEKIQNGIYNFYVSKLIGELQAATQANKQVDASIYGGVLSGLMDANIRTLIGEGKKRQKKKEK